MATKLDEIFEYKKSEIVETKKSVPLEFLKQKIAENSRKPLDVLSALRRKEGVTNIIAEIKKATPFKGDLRPGIDPVEFAKIYEKNGAVAISVLTESNYFKGSLKYLSDIKENVNIPLLRKDFIFDKYQIYEALAFGADFFLLIATYLDQGLLRELIQFGEELGLPAIIEVHDEKDLKKTFAVNAKIIGINNRDLKTGSTDLKVSHDLLKNDFDDDQIIVSESGIKGHKEIQELTSLGSHSFLIGETLMLANDIPAKLCELRGIENG